MSDREREEANQTEGGRENSSTSQCQTSRRRERETREDAEDRRAERDERRQQQGGGGLPADIRRQLSKEEACGLLMAKGAKTALIFSLSSFLAWNTI